MIAGYREVVFSAQGENYTFRWGTNALRLLEKTSGLPSSKFFQRIAGEDVTMEDLTLVMFCGLSRNHDLTMDQVGDLIDDIGGAEKIIEIFTQSMPEKAMEVAGKPANPPKQKASGTGKKR